MNKSIVKRLVDQAIARSRQPKPVKKVEYKTYKDFNLKSPYDWDIAGVAITYANDVRKWYDLFDFRGEFVFGGAIHYDTRKIRQDLFFMIVHDRDLNIKSRLGSNMIMNHFCKRGFILTKTKNKLLFQ